MSRITYSMTHTSIKPAISPLFCWTIGVAATFILLAAGCDTKVTPPSTPEPLVMNENFPIAEPALSNAVIRGDFKEIQRIVASGGNINSKDTLDRTPLHLAAFYGRTKTIEFLISNGAEVDARDHIGMTPLHAAVISGGRQSVQFRITSYNVCYTKLLRSGVNSG